MTTKTFNFSDDPSIVSGMSAYKCESADYYNTIYANSTSDYKSIIYITKSNLQSIVGSSATINSVTVTFTKLTDTGTGYCYGGSTSTKMYVACGFSDAVYPTVGSISEGTINASSGQTKTLTASYSDKPVFVMTCRLYSSDTAKPRARLTSITIDYSISCSITGTEEISLDKSTWYSSTTSSDPLQLTKPVPVYFRAHAECNDSTCGSVSGRSWALRKGTSTSGTIIQYNSSYTDASISTINKTYGSNGSGIYNIVFVASGCSASALNKQAFFNVAESSKSNTVNYNGTEVEVIAGTLYNAPSPRDIILKFTDTWGGYYNLYIGTKKTTESTYSYTSASDTSVTKTINVSDSDVVYDVIYQYGDSTTKTDVISFQIGLAEPVSTYQIKRTTDTSYIDVTAGTNYDSNVGTNDGINVSLKYTNTYGSTDCQLGIMVDSVIPSGYTSTSSSIEKTYKFTTNGIHTISYIYSSDSWGTYTIDCSFTITTRGIVTGTPRIKVGGKTIYDSSEVFAQFDGLLVEVTGLTGLDVGEITYSWSVGGTSVTESDYNFVPVSYYGTLTLYTTGLNYTVTCIVKSYGVSVQTATFGSGSISCIGKTVADITSITPSAGDTSTTFTASGFSYYPTRTSKEYLEPVWSMKDSLGNVLTEGTDYTVSERSHVDTAVTLKFKSNVTGNLTLCLTTTAHESLVLGTDTYLFNVANIIGIDIPVTKRYSIALFNELAYPNSRLCVLERTGTNTLFDQLEFTSELNNIGTASFNVIGGNNLECYVCNTSISDISKVSASDIVTNGTKVVIYDNLVPIWHGIITSVDPYNVNFYNSVVDTSIVKVTCEESMKEMSYKYTTNSTYTGTINSITQSLLYVENDYDHRGEIATSDVNYAMSFDVTSVLSALDAISNQVGWRYRCRPRIVTYGDTLTVTQVSGLYYTLTFNSSYASTIKKDDIIAIYTGTHSGTTYEDDGRYVLFRVNNVDSTSCYVYEYSTDLSKIDTSRQYHFSVLRNFMIDFKPAYYQDYVPVSLIVNQYAQNVNAVSTSADKFGEISIYGVGNSGETITSTMRAWMDIEKDYTIPYSARITESYDSTVDSISMNKQFTWQGYIWSEFTVVLNGWSFPNSTSFDFGSHPATIYFKSPNDNILSIKLANINNTLLSSYVTRYTDQSGMEKTSVLCAYKVSTDTGGDIPYTDTTTWIEDGDTGEYLLLANVLSSLSSLTNVIFNVCKVHSDSHILSDIIPTSKSIRIGDMKVTSNTISDATGVLTFTWIVTTDIPHGHLTDTLVIDDSGTKYVPLGCNYDNPTTNSPYKKYSSVRKTVQGAEGYSAMELERLACRYMQYGSNYDSRGSADVVYTKFIKSDYTSGCKRILSVGDRIEFQKIVENNGSLNTYELYNFELISYDVDLSKNTVSITFGMPFIEIGDVIYNMLSNSGMSIIPATNSSGS